MSLVLIAIVAWSAFLVYFDTTSHGIGKVDDQDDVMNLSATQWMFAFLLFWAVAAPIYLYNRRRLVERARDNHVIENDRQLKLRVLGGFALLVTILRIVKAF